jgi:hypothetical protein
MFGKKKEKEQEQEEERKQRERLARQLLKKNHGRMVFGFRCIPEIKANVKKVANELHVFGFALGEHCMELGLWDVNQACKDPDQREELRLHLMETHTQQRTIEILSRYDEEAAGYLTEERNRRFLIEQGTRRLVVKFSRWFKPRELEELIDIGYRTKVAMANGWPPPPNLAQYRPRPQRARPDGDRQTQRPDDPEDSAGEKSS